LTIAPTDHRISNDLKAVEGKEEGSIDQQPVTARNNVVPEKIRGAGTE
jgi:hypothetical protein